MTDVKLPRIYLIKRGTAREDAVQCALSINPLAAVIVASAEDVEIGTALDPNAILLTGAPIGIVADFEHPLVAVNEDGSLDTVCPAPEQSSKS